MRFRKTMAGLCVAALIALAACTSKNVEAPPEGGARPTVATADVPGAQSGSQGRLACDTPEHDWGAVMAGQDVNHTFVVKNVGDGVLRILNARGG